jgi:hypothetical protein
MLLAWKSARVITYAGYILGFPNDTIESIRHDIEIIKKELPVDLLEFFFLTPLPGSEDHRTLLDKGVWMDGDLNKYNLHHRVTHHGKMSDREWEEAYDAAWKSYYSDAHIETVARRHAGLSDRRVKTAVRYMMEFRAIYEIEGIHPLEGGIVRLKYRTDRRPEMGIEWPGVFHVKLAAEVLWKLWHYGRIYYQGWRIIKKVAAEPARASYMDTALTPAAEDDFEHLAIFTETAGAGAAIARKRTQDRIRVEFGTSAKPAA